LARTLFPLGEIHKTELRRIARALGLPNAAKRASTGICFIGERPVREFLNRYLPTQPGPILSVDGQALGEHQGLAFYTLGQRKGLGIGGVRGMQQADGTAQAWYVARKDLENNVLYVVQGHDHPWLLSQRLEAGDASWIAGAAPVPGRYSAKTRYRQSDAPCALQPDGERFSLVFDEQQWAVTPGQSAVLYDGEVCRGGGVIEA